MKQLRVICFFILIFTIFNISVFAQENSEQPNTFTSKELSFNYPSGWKITDKSTNFDHHLIVHKPNSEILIVVASPKKEITEPNKFILYSDNPLISQYTSSISQTLSTSEKKVTQHNNCLSFKNRKLGGNRFIGTYKNVKAKGDIYSIMMDNRIINLVYMRTENESSAGDLAWNEILKSIKVDDIESPKSIYTFGVKKNILNSMARKKAKIFLPPKWERSGSPIRTEVIVKVVVDETGNVVNARAISGHPDFFKESKRSAKKWKFTPFLECGFPTKIVGNISFNFISEGRK